MKREDIEFLVTMRAVTPEYVVRGSVFTKFCKKCLARLVNAPSGVRFLRENPGVASLCKPCFDIAPPGTYKQAGFAATPEELERELRDPIPNPWKNRN